MPTQPDPHVVSVHAKTLVFEDPLSRRLLHELRRVAPSDATVLVLGETGTGKEIVARYVHELSHRAERPFVAVNCGGFSDTLVDSELFGHEKGAFTGAAATRLGWFEAADGGTLFLDEVGDLPLHVQVKLLRVLQEREVVRLGSRQARPVDVRLVAATNVDLQQAVHAGRFREDLFFRLNVMSLRVPALRERPGDILPLAEHFLRVYGERSKMGTMSLSMDAVQLLLDHAWPGNVRELENVVHRAVLTCHDGRIEATDLPWSTPSKQKPSDPDSPGAELVRTDLERVLLDIFERGGEDTYHQIEEVVVTTAYRFCHENQLQTARLLGISRNVLRARLARVGLIAGRAAPRANPTNADPVTEEAASSR